MKIENQKVETEVAINKFDEPRRTTNIFTFLLKLCLFFIIYKFNLLINEKKHGASSK